MKSLDHEMAQADAEINSVPWQQFKGINKLIKKANKMEGMFAPKNKDVPLANPNGGLIKLDGREGRLMMNLLDS